MFKKLVSGGQTGADRAALDWALNNRYPCGGWCPKGRRAEDGIIDERYPLVETESSDYLPRTRLNVEDSDGTLIVNLGKLDGGSLATLRFAEGASKPILVVQADSDMTPALVHPIIHWLRANAIRTLNVAGPRESKRPGIYQVTLALLDAVAAASMQQQ